MRLNAKDMERRKCRTYEDLLFNKNAGILGTVGKLRVTGDGCIPCGNASFTERTAATFLHFSRELGGTFLQN